MIERHSDHAANERAVLAWGRTAIVGMMVLAAVRFRKAALDISSADMRPGGGAGMDDALVVA